jgi:hypothetical protein
MQHGWHHTQETAPGLDHSHKLLSTVVARREPGGGVLQRSGCFRDEPLDVWAAFLCITLKVGTVIVETRRLRSKPLDERYGDL